jgi:transcriptional regulator with XRE-family HTH domain
MSTGFDITVRNYSKVREARLRAGLSQLEVAEAVGSISRATVAGIELGTRTVKATHLIAIADVLDVEPRELLQGDVAVECQTRQELELLLGGAPWRCACEGEEDEES